MSGVQHISRIGLFLRLWLLALFLLPTLAFAQTSATLPHTSVSVVPETKAPMAGRRFTLAVVLTPRTGWHTYWEHPGDAGLPPTAKWTLPEGATASPFRFPVPETFVVSGIMNHVYGHRNILLTEITLPRNIPATIPIGLRLDWLVCDDRLCVPEGADFSVHLPRGDGTPDPAEAALFRSARHALPRPLTEIGRYQKSGDALRIAIPLAGNHDVTGAHFFPKDEHVFQLAAPQTVRQTDDALILEAKLATSAPPARLSGLVRVERGSTVQGFDVTATEGAVPAGAPLVKNTAQGMQGFALTLGLAILGGLILNLMPCVFPILSLKAMSLARAGGSLAEARREGIAYTAGVTLVTTVLGAAVVLLTRAGAGAGWAFQLQDPRVILLLLLLTLAIGLNFAGLFAVNLRPPSAANALPSGTRGAFLTGTLAAFVATPCTGPFMAGALGAALVLPPAQGIAVFAGLGLGLALPFLLLGFVPRLQALLPRPGPWMRTFQRILAIPMLLTALALAWVLGRQAGVNGMAVGLALALLVALLLWWAGLRQARGARALLPALAALLVAVAAPFALAATPATAIANDSPRAPSDTVAFSPERLATLRREGKPVLLYFTADWCLTCKVNEHGALASPAVAQSFRARDITVMVGDWTLPDPAIAHFLEQHERAGIPFYIFYSASGAEQVLPQLLTVGTLTALGR